MGIMQPQKAPRGRTMVLAEKIAQAVDRENRRTGGKLKVSHILRALEWARYTITEAVVKQTGNAPVD